MEIYFANISPDGTRTQAWGRRDLDVEGIYDATLPQKFLESGISGIYRQQLNLLGSIQFVVSRSYLEVSTCNLRFITLKKSETVALDGLVA